MEVLRAKRKKVIEGREKPIWQDVGFTLLIGDWQGRTTYTMIDERTGEKYSMFKQEKKEWGDNSSRPAPVDSPDGYTAVTPPPAMPPDTNVPF